MPLELSEVTRPGVRSLLLVAGLLKELKIANARPVTEAIQLPLVQGDVNWQTTLVMEEVHMNVTTFLAREPVHEIPAASPPNLSFFQAAESAAAALGGAAICAAHRTSLSSFFASFSEFCKMDGLDSATGKLCGGEFAEKPSEGKEEKTESCNVEEVQQPKWRRRLLAAGLVGTLLLAALLCKRLGDPSHATCVKAWVSCSF